jgi:hypothetical protein
MKLYHGTSWKNLVSILCTGSLRPKAGRLSNVWEDGKKTKGVCLTSDYKMACAWASRKCLKTNQTPVVIVVNRDNSKLFTAYEERNDGTRNWAKISKVAIPTREIIEWHTVKKMPGKEVSKIVGRKLDQVIK